MEALVSTPTPSYAKDLARAVFQVRGKRLLEIGILEETVEQRFADFFRKFQTKLITATSRGCVKGYQVLYFREDQVLELNPGTILGGFPVILEGENHPQQVARLLFEESNNIVPTQGVDSLEIVTSLEEEQNPLTSLFQQQGFQIEQKYAEMIYCLSPASKDPQVPGNISIHPLREASKEVLLECYLEAFRTGDAPFFHSQSQVQQSNFFETLGLDDARSHPASMILVDGKKLLGFSMVIGYGQQNAHVSCMCIEQTYRGKGLGKMLLQMIFHKAWENGDKTITLGTDIRMKAFQLYVKHGFEVTNASILWRKRNPKQP
ncbi:MAG TPA: GNAT family N-acetyltransferase [Thermotogota bacterium]|nr:GNAT family N-acetyltransferase [Thermotogota bacterium]